MSNSGNPVFDLFDFFELTPDLVCITGKDGYFRHVNLAVSNLLEYTPDELRAVPVANFIHPDDKELTASRRFKLLCGEPLINFQNRYLTKTGRTVWLHWTSIFIPEKEVVFAIAKDVTERKRTEQQVEDDFRRFRNLASHFKYSLEKDRKRLAVELHEELAQLASAVKVDLNWIQNNTSSMPQASMARITHAISISDSLINSIRKLSYALSPDMLESLGLHESLKWLCEEFHIIHRIVCDFRNDTDVEWLSAEIKLDLFRICQEALNDILAHTDVSLLQITINSSNGVVTLVIHDNGLALQPEYRGETLAMREIRERVSSIDGTLEVDTPVGAGTNLTITVMNKSPF